MKDDLKRLIKEFIEESKSDRTEIIKKQDTKDSPIIEDRIIHSPTFQDFIYWLNQ